MPITKASSNAVAPAAKGDLVVGSATNDSGVLSVGANDTVLTADSSTATGLKWATPASGSMTLLSTTSLTGGGVTASSINQTYKELFVLLRGVYYSSDNFDLRLFFGGSTNHNYQRFGVNGSTFFSDSGRNENLMLMAKFGSNSGLTYGGTLAMRMINYSSAGIKSIFGSYFGVLNSGSRVSGVTNGTFTGSAITSFTVEADNQTFSGGEMLIYGVN
jgi:hypothetical protein